MDFGRHVWTWITHSVRSFELILIFIFCHALIVRIIIITLGNGYQLLWFFIVVFLDCFDFYFIISEQCLHQVLVALVSRHSCRQADREKFYLITVVKR